nr:MAG TPA: hypothetical protein [Caudoviricetes sp.]
MLGLTIFNLVVKGCLPVSLLTSFNQIYFLVQSHIQPLRLSASQPLYLFNIS